MNQPPAPSGPSFVDRNAEWLEKVSGNLYPGNPPIAEAAQIIIDAISCIREQQAAIEGLLKFPPALNHYIEAEHHWEKARAVLAKYALEKP